MKIQTEFVSISALLLLLAGCSQEGDTFTGAGAGATTDNSVNCSVTVDDGTIGATINTCPDNSINDSQNTTESNNTVPAVAE